MTAPKPIDLLIEARWIVPVQPSGNVLEHHAVAVHAGRIVDLLPGTEALARYEATEHVQLAEHVLIPGLVNTHTHAAMSLMRGIADDLPLMRWLKEAIWPTETAHVSADFVRDGTLLAAAEMLRGGVTTTNDMYFFPDAAAQAFAEAGMRATIGLVAVEFPTAWAADADDYLRKGLAVRDQWQEHALLSFPLAPHAPYTVSDATFARIATLAQELDASVHLHLHETRDEIEQSLREHRMRPLERLERLGLLGPGLSVAHAVHMTEPELALLAERGVAVAHNPTSNMKLASGIAPVARMQALGIPVGLGTDGAASNNRHDIFQEMRHAALLAKVASGDASTLPAHTALRMATLDGARTLGLDAQTGSIEIGKAADLCAVSLADPLHLPCYDIVSHLCYVLGREQVSDVWVAGSRRLHTNRLVGLDNDLLHGIVNRWQGRLSS